MGIRWDESESARLKAARGLGFREIIGYRLLALLKHPGGSSQRYLLFEIAGYVWVVACVHRGDDLFLKTAFPSRKYTKLWRAGELP